VAEAMREVRTALLEADVHVDVVKSFCDEVLADSLGTEVTRSLRPDQEMIGIVHRKLVELMGPVDSHIMLVEPPPTVVMVCGLQGSGKTTTVAKLAAYLKRRGKSVMVVAADLQRPAAVEQLRVLTEQVNRDGKGPAPVHFYAEPERCAEYRGAIGVAVDVCRHGLAEAKRAKVDVLVLDTAGRLHIDEELMRELDAVNRAVAAHQIYLVLDAMIGQDAVNSARAFHGRLNVDGIILTKFDSDTRGGAAMKDMEVNEKQLDRLEGIVHSMTGKEREDIALLNKSRIKRIARGSGTTTAEVNRLTKQFEMLQKVTRQAAGGGMRGRLKALRDQARAEPGATMPALKNMPALPQRGSTKISAVKKGFKQRRKGR
jgi:signal recognition particle subunit SRP54